MPLLGVRSPCLKRHFLNILQRLSELIYSHLSNNRGGCNKRGGGAKVAKSINVEVGIIVKVGIFLKKSINVEGGFLCGG